MEIVHLLINVLSAGLTVGYLAIVGFFIRGWLALPKPNKMTGKSNTRVAVIIAARNEAGYITRTLEALLAQRYDKELLEILVVNDHSTDKTAAIVAGFAAQGVKLIDFNEAGKLNSYKKKAIQIAIGQTQAELIITTDADCCMGPDWLPAIVAYYEQNSYEMISSPVAYFEENGLFEHCQGLEFCYLIGLGASTIGNKMPATCNGANLAYTRQAFERVNGFSGIDDLASGDDELLMHKIAENDKTKIGFLKDRSAIVYTYAKPTFRAFMDQRKRWASKTTRYKNKSIIILNLMIWAFNVSVALNAVLALLFPSVFSYTLPLMQTGLKFFIEFLFLIIITHFFNKKVLLVLLPLLTISHIFYMVYIGIAGHSGTYSWKGRVVK